MIEKRNERICPVIAKIRQALKENRDAHTQATGQNFFKEKIKVYGVKTAIVGKIAKTYFREVKDIGKAGIFDLCEHLWQSGYMEEAFIACNWSYFIRNDYEPQDFRVFESWVNQYVSNWASCDTLCNHTVAAFVEKYPEYIEKLKQWSKSKNRWVRRASAVTLIIPARHGKFLKDIFEIADILLLDGDDLVQKGYGWMLKAASEAHQKEVWDYVMKNKAHMPRIALRYAIEKMTQDRKAKAMAK
ncbi:MAG TPA: DNA alkylation repair protein [Candidatus Omnitrophota bacterium]|nr:DNA alkylation repair protein [Candidatus Omnitrophota bacterium]HQO58743.1 DNA alkylation repair protein [Candidatus Omnitrophota bacterium]